MAIYSWGIILISISTLFVFSSVAILLCENEDVKSL